MTDGQILQRTQSAFVWTRLLRTPFWALYGMLPFMLYRDLGATPFQIAVAVSLKPAVSILSVYWSTAIVRRPDRLLSNVIWAGVLGVFPFFFFPFFDNPWFFIGAFGLFMLLHRGVIPAWMEILRRNVPGVTRERLFAYSSAVGYLGDALFPLAIGWVLDGYVEAWRWVFPATAFISLLAVFFQMRIPIQVNQFEKKEEKLSLRDPWRNAWKLLSHRFDFLNFQVGFMLGGAGLMVIQPALPMYFVDVLDVSYMELAIALTFCKGIGFAFASPLFAEWMQRVDLWRFSSLVTALGALFPLMLLASAWNIGWLYVAYLGYGIMQAGSELSWNLSGPIFSKNEDSSIYTSVNIFTVGLRGCLIPPLGGLLYAFFGAAATLWMGSLMLALATGWMWHYSNKNLGAQVA